MVAVSIHRCWIRTLLTTPRYCCSSYTQVLLQNSPNKRDIVTRYSCCSPAQVLEQNSPNKRDIVTRVFGKVLVTPRWKRELKLLLLSLGTAVPCPGAGTDSPNKRDIGH